MKFFMVVITDIFLNMEEYQGEIIKDLTLSSLIKISGISIRLFFEMKIINSLYFGKNFDPLN